MLFDELGEVPLSVVEASANHLMDPVQSAGLTRAANALQCELHDAVADARARTFGRINDGLASLTGIVSPAELVERAPALLCEVCEFDRAIISRVHGSTWVPAAVHVAAGAGDEVNVGLVAAIRTLEIPLTSALIETEMLRRRTSVLVDGTAAARHTFSVLGALSRSRAYVAAPIVIANHVAGFFARGRLFLGTDAHGRGPGRAADLRRPVRAAVRAGRHGRAAASAAAGHSTRRCRPRRAASPSWARKSDSSHVPRRTQPRTARTPKPTERGTRAGPAR